MPLHALDDPCTACVLLGSTYAGYDEYYAGKDQHDHLGVRAHPKIPSVRRRASCHNVKGPSGNDETETEYYGYNTAKVHRATNMIKAVTADKPFECACVIVSSRSLLHLAGLRFGPIFFK